MRWICEIQANGWYKRHCTHLGASGSPSLTWRLPSDFDYVELVRIEKTNKCRTPFLPNLNMHFIPLTSWRMEDVNWDVNMLFILDGYANGCMHGKGVYTHWNARYRIYKYGCMHFCKKLIHSSMHRRTNNTHDCAPVPMSNTNVWLHILTSVILLRIFCPDAEKFVFRIVVWYSKECGFIPSYSRKTSLPLCCITLPLIPLFSSVSHLLSVSSSIRRKSRLYLPLFVFPFHFVLFHFTLPFLCTSFYMFGFKSSILWCSWSWSG